MTRSICATLGLLFLVSFVVAQEPIAPPVAGLMRYKEAILAVKGKEAWKCVDSHTRDYYDQSVKDALSAPKADVQKMGLGLRFMVLRCRVEFSKAELDKMTGEDLFVIGVDRQWISRSSVQTIDKVAVLSNDGRIASLALAQAPKQAVFTLLLEDGEWKLAISRLFAFADVILKKQAEDAGMTEDELLLALLHKVSRYQFDEKVWDGPVR
jgi:hypothetical protein